MNLRTILYILIFPVLTIISCSIYNFWLLLRQFSILSKWRSTKNILILPKFYGGGGILLGGPFILYLYLGMLGGKYAGNMSKMRTKQSLVLTAFSTLCILYIEYMIAVKGLILDRWKLLGKVDANPTGVSVILYAFIVLMCVRLWNQAISSLQLKVVNDLMTDFAWIGRQTLYIFLYHTLILDYLLNRYFSELNRTIKIPLYYLTMVFGSIGMGYLHRYLRKLIVSGYTFVKEE